MDEMGWACSMHKEINTYKILVAHSHQKKLLGRPRCKWEGNIKMHLTEIGCDGVTTSASSG
jgi:hypothetical protein